MPLNTGSVPFILQCFYKWSFYFPLTEIQRICLFLCHFHLTTKKLLQCILISMGKLISIGPELFACFFLFICLLSSVQFSRSVVFDTLQPHELQHARPPYPSPTPGVYQNLCALSRWCHPTISSSVVPFSSYPQSFPASGSLNAPALHIRWPKYWVSASTSVLLMNIQDWSPLGWTGWISLQSKGLSRSSPKQQSKSINSLVRSFLYSPTLTSIQNYWKNHSLD